ncbi:MAG TPA: inositol monophosphatase family protein [Mycobacteriales bacterium]|jgi:fructose-1,6-bisphosphatase/inositol monophosphatase family enzyme|nr:inositol monophosphatase family protein [Mycobacteriales bacterium]
MIDASTVTEVDRIIRSAAAREILPRFGHLASGDIAEKAPGDLVTVADNAAEEVLTRELTSLLPGSVVVGEESVAADPAVLRDLDGDKPVWIVDPIDGTRNYANNNARFSTLVALAERGELLASWTYVPVFDTMAHAVSGAGAFVDEQRVHVAESPVGLRFLDVATPHSSVWGPGRRAQYNALSRSGVALTIFDVSGLEYIELASGRRTAMVLTWEFPWDHAAGLLLHAEAGGITTTADGTPFTLAGGNALPFVAAPDVDCATALHDAIAGK